ncbi:unnamed protein product [Euphydryas editha]|uniref:PiggyBac transposable element-derived protein domain-containing protein n=1 Tax=Euphydryas editha TaxID=104508 RepID=A0AAU9USK3_EUPED|nr:unnamed protein product [Euphydryas editha]
MSKWRKPLRDQETEEELIQLFGIDNPEKSEDEFEPELENLSDYDLRSMFTEKNLDSVPSYSNQIEISHAEGDEVVTTPAEQSTSTTNVISRTSSPDPYCNSRIPSPEPTTSNYIRRPSPEPTTLNYIQIPSTEPTTSNDIRSPSPASNTAQITVPENLTDSIDACTRTPEVSHTVLPSDTDSSDDEENTWKKVLFPQKPDVDSFDSVTLQSKQFFPSRTRPVSYFSIFFNEDVIELILTQTNIYAEQNRSRNWTAVNSAEIKAFIGMIIMMGINPLPSIDLFWSSDPFFRNNEIAAVMPIKRFKKILENVHLNDNEGMPLRGAPNYDKLYKIRPFLELINKACQNNAKNTKSQSIDEAMVKFKGVSSLKQYMPMKPVKRGYKIWIRADSATGYVFEFDVYTRKRDDKTTEVGLGGNVVKRLTKKSDR